MSEGIVVAANSAGSLSSAGRGSPAVPSSKSVHTREACKAHALYVFLLAFVSFALPVHAGDGAVPARDGMVVAQEAPAAEAADAEAERNMEIGRYYISRDNYVAAVTRFKTVVTRYQSSQQVAEALARLTKVYLALGVPAEARTAAAVLARKFPNSRWSAEAANAVRSAGLEPLENP